MNILKNTLRGNRKKFLFFLCGLGIAVFLLVAGFLFFNNFENSYAIYVYPKNPKQGDTIFVRVKSRAVQIAGNFASQKINFLKKGSFGERIAFLGVDADQTPGDYQIFADTSNAEHLAEKIKVEPAEFSSQKPIIAPTANGITKQKAASNIVKNDNPALKKILENSSPEPYFYQPFSYPLKEIKTTGLSFGKFIDFTKYKIQHLGVDLKAPQDTDIYAVNNGKVAGTLDLSNYGKTVVIDHGMGIFSIYLHLDKFEVAEGQTVSRGQLIGLSGDTGYATAPHLHFSMRANGARVDPIAFINATQKMNENFLTADIASAFLKIFNFKK